MPVEAVAIGLPMALGLGLVYGLGPCLISCLPYLGPLFVNAERGIAHSWRILLPVSLGRLTVYGSFGAISGWWGGRYVGGVNGWVVHLTVGVALVLVGVALLGRRSAGAACGACASGGEQKITWHRSQAAAVQAMPSGLYLMGVGMALTPCAPQGAVLVAAAASGTPWSGAALGLSFGLGAIAAPWLVYGTVVAYVGQQLREQLGRWQPRIEVLSAFLLLGTGLVQLWQGASSGGII
jgi:cytochrome c biogenesis protein CcdA